MSLRPASGGHLNSDVSINGLPDLGQVGLAEAGRLMEAACPGSVGSGADGPGGAQDRGRWALPLDHWGGCEVARSSGSVLLTAWLK